MASRAFYCAPGGTHAPHHPTVEWVAKLTAWPKDLAQWDTLTPEAKKLYIRQADVYAAYLAYTDHEIGRVIQAVEDAGKLGSPGGGL